MRLADQHPPAQSAHKVTQEQKSLGRYILGSVNKVRLSDLTGIGGAHVELRDLVGRGRCVGA